MPIIVVCECGKRLRAPDTLAGKRVKCPSCGAGLAIPGAAEDVEARAPEDESEARAAEPAPSRRPAFSKEVLSAEAARRYGDVLNRKPVHSWRDFTYFVLILALVPLGFSLFADENESVMERLNRTIEKAPPAAQRNVERIMQRTDGDESDFTELIAALPDGRLDGAHLPRKTFVHYAYAAAAAVGFFILGIFLLRSEDSNPLHLLGIGVFTGTFGIVFLLLAQLLAGLTQGHILISRNIIVMALYWIAWAIGFSYSAALDADIGFVGSFLGFTFGVGLCEEACKALPVILYYFRTDKPRWNVACTMGFASGVGFGVAEGIMYAGNYYNGIAPAGTYFVRFVSCVALHAIWSVSSALFIHKHQALIRDIASGWDILPRVVAVVAVPMVLHGLYDTALKKDYNLIALLAALASFAWLVWCMETARGFDEATPARKPKRGKTRFA